MLTELLYPLQDGYTPLHLAASGGHTTCVERLLSSPGINVNIGGKVNPSIESYCMNNILYGRVGAERILKGDGWNGDM